MKTVELVRLEMGKDGTFGMLLIDGKCFCVTLELPWNDNKNDISCIPEGTYKCKIADTASHGRCYQVCSVPQRDAILFHEANWISELKGCLALGTSIGFPDGIRRGICNSRMAVGMFEDEMDGEDFELEIVEFI